MCNRSPRTGNYCWRIDLKGSQCLLNIILTTSVLHARFRDGTMNPEAAQCGYRHVVGRRWPRVIAVASAHCPLAKNSRWRVQDAEWICSLVGELQLTGGLRVRIELVEKVSLGHRLRRNRFRSELVLRVSAFLQGQAETLTASGRTDAQMGILGRSYRHFARAALAVAGKPQHSNGLSSSRSHGVNGRRDRFAADRTAAIPRRFLVFTALKIGAAPAQSPVVFRDTDQRSTAP
jgi:hypothetical protein